ncbi:MAG: TonB-dependent receptor [Carboxylicivirga sp.]|jgi:iron complex outermembrane receptor protein|nr:TonB-dependent receptor [Carboxylicivirga sp.]
MLLKSSNLLNAKYFHLFLVLFSLTRLSIAQNSRDSVIIIQSVDVTANYIFKKEEAGIKVTKMDSLVMQNKTTASLADLLTQNSTVYIKNYGRGALSTASFRGTAPTHTQVTWNGMDMNSPMLGMVDFSNVPVYILDDVSILYGSASISQNSGALGGNINLSNKVDWTNRFGGTVLQGFGSFSTYDNMLRLDFGSSAIQSKTRLYRSSSENDYKFINKHLPGYPEVKNENGDYSKYGLVQELYYRCKQRWVSSAKIWLQDGNRSIPMVMSFEGNDEVQRSNQQDDRTAKGVIDLKYYGDKTKWLVQSGVDYQELDYVMRIDVNGLGEQKPVNSGSEMLSSQNKMEMRHAAGERLSFKAAVNIDYFNISCLDTAQMTGYDEERMEYSAFVGAYLEPLSWMNLSLEGRKDWIPQTSPPLVYNIALSIKPIESQNLVWKSSLARNFHNPSLNDLYWVPGGNPDLVPEEGHTVETGFHYVYKRPNTKLDVQVSGYYSDIDNWILWLPSGKGPWEALNIKNVLSRGIEGNIQFSQRLNNWQLLLQANYAYTKTTNEGEALNGEDASVGMQLPFIPLHSGNALFGIRYKNTFFNYQHQYYGERFLLSSNMETINDDSDNDLSNPFYKLYAVPLNHLSIGQQLNIRKLSVNAELKVHNLFDESYRNILNRFMPGRHYECLISVKF